MGDEKDKDRAARILDLEGDNFLGTGMSFAEFRKSHDVVRFANSFFAQGRLERKRRIEAVTRLGAELQRIRKVSVFCCSLGEAAMEAVIEGDWAMAETWAAHFTFVEEGEHVAAAHAPLWAEFVRILREAYDARPPAPEDGPVRVH